jgi:mannose-6-phosphate isomerase-like protein (cupin superfamily)
MDNFLRLENRHSGEVLLIRRVRDDQGRIVLALEGTLPPGTEGPPLHIHLQEDEVGIVAAGSLGAQVGTEKIVIPAGGVVNLPKGVRHRWWNAGNDVLKFNGHAVPAVDLDRFPQAVFVVLNASEGRPSIFYLAHVLWRHRKTQQLMIPPPAIQKIVFPLVLLIGRIAGKYRGSNWPGSPESCTGAPLIELAVRS